VRHQRHREGFKARCTVERLMRADGLRGARRDHSFVTTRPNPGAARPPDVVNRAFTATHPNQLWGRRLQLGGDLVGDGVHGVRVRRVSSTRIVGRRTASSMPTDLPLDALEMASWVRARAGDDINGVLYHRCRFATLSWAHWFNQTRLHSSIGHMPRSSTSTATSVTSTPTATSTEPGAGSGSSRSTTANM
jgi:putative transposase